MFCSSAIMMPLPLTRKTSTQACATSFRAATTPAPAASPAARRRRLTLSSSVSTCISASHRNRAPLVTTGSPVQTIMSESGRIPSRRRTIADQPSGDIGQRGGVGGLGATVARIDQHPGDLPDLEVGGLGDPDQLLPGLVAADSGPLGDQSDSYPDRALGLHRELEVPDLREESLRGHAGATRLALRSERSCTAVDACHRPTPPFPTQIRGHRADTEKRIAHSIGGRRGLLRHTTPSD